MVSRVMSGGRARRATVSRAGAALVAGLLIAGCSRGPAPPASPTQSLSSACLAVSTVTVQSLGPPSPRPALAIAAGSATGRTGTYIGDGYQYVTKTLGAADWRLVQRAACAEQVYYGLGPVTIDSGGTVGGQVFIDIATGTGSSELAFGASNVSADPLIGTLRSLATRYFGSATF